MRIKSLFNFNSRIAAFVTISLLIALTNHVFAQQINNLPSADIYPLTDPAISKHFKGKPENEKSHRPDTTHSPAKAVTGSALLPGLGQIYNHKWYKVPFIYAGFSLLTVVIIYNYRHYEQDLIVYRYYKDPSKVKKSMPEYDYYKNLVKHNYSKERVADAYNVYNRDFQLAILGVAGLWLLQMADAYVDAKFIHSFSMDDNLSFKLSPGIQPVFAANYNASVMPVLTVSLSLY